MASAEQPNMGQYWTDRQEQKMPMARKSPFGFDDVNTPLASELIVSETTSHRSDDFTMREEVPELAKADFLPGVQSRSMVILDVCDGCAVPEQSPKESKRGGFKANMKLVKEILLPGSKTCFCGMFSWRQGLVLFGMFDSLWAISFAFGHYLPSSAYVERTSEILLFLLHLTLPVSNAFGIRAAYIEDPVYSWTICGIHLDQKRFLHIYMWSQLIFWSLIVAFVIVHMSAVAQLEDDRLIGLQKSFSRTNVFIAAFADLLWGCGSILWKFSVAANFLHDQQSLDVKHGSEHGFKSRDAPKQVQGKLHVSKWN